MLTEFARDHAFTIAWFGLMAFVWFGWGQEDPPQPWRWRLGAGSMLGLAVAGTFGFGVISGWDRVSALDGRYHWFGLMVLLEVLAAGLGCFVLLRRGKSRWMAGWVALIVAVHFIGLAPLLGDWSLAILGIIQVAALMLLRGTLTRANFPTSRLVGPTMGTTFLAFAVVSAAIYLTRHGAPW